MLVDINNTTLHTKSYSGHLMFKYAIQDFKHPNSFDLTSSKLIYKHYDVVIEFDYKYSFKIMLLKSRFMSNFS